MKDNLSMSELLLSDTSIPDIFIVQYMASLSKDALCLYMWISMNCGKSSAVTKDIIDSYGLLSGEDTRKVISELISKNLLIKGSDDNYILEDLKKAEVNTYIKSKVGTEVEGDFEGIKSGSEERDVLAASISKTFYQGRMPYIFFKLVDTCLYEYKFEKSVVYSLFAEGRDLKIHLKIDDMLRMAASWNKYEYTTMDKLKVYYKRKKDNSDIAHLMGKLSRRRLNDIDLERIDNWVNELHTTTQLAEYAFRVNEYRGNITLKHVEDKLREWYAAGIESIDAAAVYENEKRLENKAKGSRKRSKDNVWKSGSEAGITAEPKSNTSVIEPAKVTEEADNSEVDPILSMFGGNDEDN